MAELSDRIAAEQEAMQTILAALPAEQQLDRLSKLEIAGIGSLLQNFYNGVENILKQIFAHQGTPLPTGHSWHNELLDQTAQFEILSHSTIDALKPFLAFRHYFVHAYALDLRVDRLAPLVQQIPEIYQKFLAEITNYLKS